MKNPDRILPPLAIELILHVYCRYDDAITLAPAQVEILCNFLADGLITYNIEKRSAHGYMLTPKGLEWVDRILGTLPPRGYGGKSPGYWIVSGGTPAYSDIENARRDIMTAVKTKIPGYMEGGFILKAIELIEPKPNFQTTYLS